MVANFISISLFAENLHLSTRVNFKYNLSLSIDDLSNIIIEIPAFTLNKITHLIGNLTGVKSENLKQYGEKIKLQVLDKVKNYQKENHLSNQSDSYVYHSLRNICRHFNEEELDSANLSTV